MENGLEQSEITGRETNQKAAAAEQLRDNEGLNWVEVLEKSFMERYFGENCQVLVTY